MQHHPVHTPTLFPAESENDLFTLGSILLILKRRWPWIILFALLGGVAAYYYAAKQGYAYEKKASVLLRNEQKQETGASERILKELGAESGTANMANESFVMKSTPLMLQVVKNLKLNTSYWKKQDIRVLDIYDASPILVDFQKIDPLRYCSLTIAPIDEQNYTLTYANRYNQETTIGGTFGIPLTLPFATVNVHPTSLFTKDQAGHPIQVNHSPELDTAKVLLSSFNVTRPDVRDSSLLMLSLKSSNPKKTANALDQIISVYNQFSKDEKTKSAQKTENFIKDLLDELEKDLKDVDDKISIFIKNSELVHDTDATLNANFTTLQQLEQNIFEIQTQIKLAKNLEVNLKNSEQNKTLLSIDTGISEKSISGQIEIYNEAYLEHKKIAGSAGSKNPVVVSLQDKMDATRHAINKSVSNYQNNLNLRLSELEKKKKELDTSMIATSSKGKNLAPMTREYKIKADRYQMLLSKRDENALSLYIAEPSARILETSYGSDAPIAPKINRYIILGAGGGSAACLLFFLLASMIDGKVWNKRDIQSISSIPVVGELPLLSEKERKSRTISDMTDRSIYSECFHILRNNVATFVPQKDDLGQIILITSTMQGEGKTLTSINLAAAFAMTGKRVLLIDGDLRKVSLSKNMGGKGQKGLSNILLNSKEKPEELIINCPENKNLDLLYSGPIPPNPILLLTNPRLSELLQNEKTKYDKIIIDAPPFGILADTAILAPYADITLYLVRSGKIDKRFFTGVQRWEEEGKVRHPAYIINAVDFKRASYRHYGYGYSYGYRYGDHGSKSDKKRKN